MARKRQQAPPPGARQTSSGRWTITIPPAKGTTGPRLSHSKVKPDEDKTYATVQEAWDGYHRVIAYRDAKKSETTTVRGFWLEWTDTEHWHWGNLPKRSEQSILAYKTRTNRFVKMFGDRQLDTIDVPDIHAYLAAGGARSSMRAIATMLHDAASFRLRPETNPAEKLAGEAEAFLRKRRAKKAGRVPEQTQIDAMLDRARDGSFPSTLYGWLLTGVRHGMRGGEIDGMEWEFLKGSEYQIDWQWNAALNRRTPPKHESYRALLLDDDVMAEIDKQRGNGSRWIWVNSNSNDHWNHDARDYWWTWCMDGEPSLRQLVGGATMYQATRHFWASWAVNYGGLSPYQASLLYGHSDGGKLITEVYAKPDHKAAMRAAADARRRYEQEQRNVIDLHTRRTHKAGGSEA